MANNFSKNDYRAFDGENGNKVEVMMQKDENAVEIIVFVSKNNSLESRYVANVSRLNAMFTKDTYDFSNGNRSKSTYTIIAHDKYPEYAHNFVGVGTQSKEEIAPNMYVTVSNDFYGKTTVKIDGILEMKFTRNNAYIAATNSLEDALTYHAWRSDYGVTVSTASVFDID